MQFHCFLSRISYVTPVPSFFFNDTATTEIYTLSLHDALPICEEARSEALEHLMEHLILRKQQQMDFLWHAADLDEPLDPVDRKSTRLNSSHANISYAVFCLKKKTDILTEE